MIDAALHRVKSFIPNALPEPEALHSKGLYMVTFLFLSACVSTVLGIICVSLSGATIPAFLCLFNAVSDLLHFFLLRKCKTDVHISTLVYTASTGHIGTASIWALLDGPTSYSALALITLLLQIPSIFGKSWRVSVVFYVFGMVDTSLVVGLRLQGVSIPGLNHTEHTYAHGISPLAQAVFDVLVIGTVCAINYLMSNWHNHSLDTLKNAAMVEDRAILLAQAHVERLGTSSELTSATADSSRMRDVSAHLMSLADDFLVFASTQAKSTFSLSLRKVPLSEICNQVEMVCGTLATEKGSAFSVSCDRGLKMMPVMCDPTRLVQVLTNLSSNGLQYTSAGGTVELQLETVEPTSQRTLQRNKPEQVTVRFSVHDNGRGMSAAEVAKVFDPFHRGADGHESGIGLGLSIVKTLVERMGGTIALESTPGVGSIFSFEAAFELASSQRGSTQHFVSFGPTASGALIPNQTPTTEPPAASTVPSGTELVEEFRTEAPLQFLVVDDNVLNMRMFERTVNNMLQKQDRAKPVYTFAANGLEAVEIFTKSLRQSITRSTLPRGFDCVFMDREMPVMGGVEATEKIIQMQQDARAPVPVIGVSASVESADNWRAVGMSYLLGKPFSRKDLGRVLRLVDKRRKPLPVKTLPTPGSQEVKVPLIRAAVTK